MNLLDIKPHVISEDLSDKIFLFYGEAGTRKTTVGAAFDGSLLAAFEIGYKFISGVRAVPITNWVEFKQLLRELKKPEVKEEYKVIVVDTISLAYSSCTKFVLAQYGVSDPGDIGFGKGWRAVRKEFEEAILSIPQMGYGLVLIAHADEMEEKDSIKAKVDIDKRPASIIKGLADFIFYVRNEYRDDSEGNTPDNQTVYAYNKLVQIETKTRSRYFSPRFEFTYENLEFEMKRAIEEQKKVEGIVTVKATSSLHEIHEGDFEQLQLDVINLATGLLNNPITAEKTYSRIESLFNGVRLSETTELHRPKLEILLAELSDIQSKL